MSKYHRRLSFFIHKSTSGDCHFSFYIYALVISLENVQPKKCFQILPWHWFYCEFFSLRLLCWFSFHYYFNSSRLQTMFRINVKLRPDTMQTVLVYTILNLILKVLIIRLCWSTLFTAFLLTNLVESQIHQRKLIILQRQKPYVFYQWHPLDIVVYSYTRICHSYKSYGLLWLISTLWIP